jgi:hypothetical protein
MIGSVIGKNPEFRKTESFIMGSLYLIFAPEKEINIILPDNNQTFFCSGERYYF